MNIIDHIEYNNNINNFKRGCYSMEKQKYYYLPLDNYNQPNGNINTIYLTRDEYLKLKETHVYIYESYTQAMLRAYN